VRAGAPGTTARLLAAQGPAPAARRVVVTALLATLADPPAVFDAAAATALAALQDPDVDRALAARATADYERWSQEAVPWLDEAAWRSLDEPGASQPSSLPLPQGKLAALLARYPERVVRPEVGSILPPSRSAADVAALVAALGRVSAARPLCLKLAAGTDPELRAAALGALAQAAPGTAPAELRGLATKALEDRAPAVRRAGAAALAALGAAALPDLVGLLGDPDFELRAVAARALGGMRSPVAVDALVKALREDSQLPIVEALGRQGDRRAVKPLLERLREDTPAGHEPERAALVEAVGALAAPEAATPLAAELWHPDAEVRLAAARALGALPAAARGASGREALEARSADPDGEVRRACARAIAGPPASAPATAPASAAAPTSAPARPR
jgi:HEAT repeat protein